MEDGNRGLIVGLTALAVVGRGGCVKAWQCREARCLSV